MRINKKSVVSRIIAAILTILFAVGANWFFLPAWNLRSAGFWYYCIFVGIVTMILWAISEYIADKNFICTKKIGKSTFIIIFVGLVLPIIFSQIFHSDRDDKLIKIQEGDFKKDIQSISTVEARNFLILDIETAQKMAKKSLKEIKNVSQYKIGEETSIVTYREQICYLLQLEYVSIEDAANSQGIPGYILVNAETGESDFIEVEIKYAPNKMFSQDLKRHLRKNFKTYIFGEIQLDIDDTGEPYYIAPVLKSTIGLFGGQKVASFVIVDAKGEYKEYLPEELPKWVDNAYSLDYLMKLAEEHYETIDSEIQLSYSNRSVEPEEENEKSFEGYTSIITKDGTNFTSVFFTGVISERNEELAFGFILASSRTGEITYYDCLGTEESKVQLQAESLYQNYGYNSSYPFIVQVDGVPTYVMLLKDNSQFNRGYVMISVADTTVSASGESLEETLVKYKAKFLEKK